MLSREARLYSPGLRADSGRQRQPAAPSHEHCGAPRVCNAEPRQRAAEAGECGEGAREGGRRRERRNAAGKGGGRRGARAPLPLAPGTRLRLQPRPVSPASRAAGPISARGGSRALRGARSLARRSRPNSGRVGLSTKSTNSSPQEQTARRRWGAPLRALAGRGSPPSSVAEQRGFETCP